MSRWPHGAGGPRPPSSDNLGWPPLSQSPAPRTVKSQQLAGGQPWWCRGWRGSAAAPAGRTAAAEMRDSDPPGTPGNKRGQVSYIP